MEEKVIGILGGMGPEATLDLFKEIIRATPATRDQEHLRVIIDNNPKVPDRTNAIIGKGADPVPEMVKSGLSLERAGAHFIVIPCISAHYFLDHLQRQLKLPILSVLDQVLFSITQDHPNINKIGLMATSGTIKGGFFQKKLAEKGIQTLVPEPDQQSQVMSAIYNIKGNVSDHVRRESNVIFIEVAARIMKNGAQGIIAGCTEIPLALKPSDLPVPVFNPLTILAAAAVRKAREASN